MKRLAVVLLVTLAALVAAAPSAQAAPPTHEREFVDRTFTEGELCGFLVEIHQTGFVIRIEWVDEDGNVRRIEAFPQGKATFTNPETGESITVNAAGPAHLIENPNGSLTVVGTGNWGFDINPETDEPGWFQVSGRWVFSVDAEGNEDFHFVGRVRDLCAELAV